MCHHQRGVGVSLVDVSVCTVKVGQDCNNKNKKKKVIFYIFLPVNKFKESKTNEVISLNTQSPFAPNEVVNLQNWSKYKIYLSFLMRFGIFLKQLSIFFKSTSLWILAATVFTCELVQIWFTGLVYSSRTVCIKLMLINNQRLHKPS